MEEKNANLDFNILDASNKRCSSVAVIVIICSYIIEKDTAFFTAATSHSKLIANKLNLMYELWNVWLNKFFDVNVFVLRYEYAD